jgi:hypothetical protein
VGGRNAAKSRISRHVVVIVNMMRRFLFSDFRRYACTKNGAPDAAIAGSAAVRYSFIVWRQPAPQFQAA